MIDHTIIDKKLLIHRLPFPQEAFRSSEFVTKGKGNLTEACFNPSIIKYGASIWMVYRAEAYPYIFPYSIGVRLNNRFEPQFTTNKRLDLRTRWNGGNAEDLRLFESGPELWGAYNDGGRIWLARFDSELNVEMCVQTETDFRLQVIEKNWSFFAFEKELYCIYLCAAEHDVLRMEWVGRQPVMCRAYRERWTPKWSWGEIRGGASPVLHDGVFYHFFHSWCPDDKFNRHYHCGVYTFEAKPPFKPISVSSVPLFSAPYQGVPLCRTNAVVFPGGAVKVDGGWVISYGLHDWDCALARISDDQINAVLTPD